MSISRDAKAQSEEAIRASLRLLRQPAYPHDRCLASLTDLSRPGV